MSIESIKKRLNKNPVFNKYTDDQKDYYARVFYDDPKKMRAFLAMGNTGMEKVPASYRKDLSNSLVERSGLTKTLVNLVAGATDIPKDFVSQGAKLANKWLTGLNKLGLVSNGYVKRSKKMGNDWVRAADFTRKFFGDDDTFRAKYTANRLNHDEFATKLQNFGLGADRMIVPLALTFLGGEETGANRLAGIADKMMVKGVKKFPRLARFAEAEGPAIGNAEFLENLSSATKGDAQAILKIFGNLEPYLKTTARQGINFARGAAGGGARALITSLLLGDDTPDSVLKGAILGGIFRGALPYKNINP